MSPINPTATTFKTFPTRVEFPIAPNSIVIRNYKTMGELKKAYSNLLFVKYIYLDPVDNKLKGINPSDGTPVVENAYITVAGELEEIIKFAEVCTKGLKL